MKYYCLYLLACFTFTVEAQNESLFKILFYNVENLFDPVNDPSVNDGEFTPDGARFWTYKKLNKKNVKIARVILAAGAFQPFDIIGLAEVENRNVLDNLVFQSPLKKLSYQVIHKDSPDKRGIDVALLYRKHKFRVVDTAFIKVTLSGDPDFKTRDIIYCKGIILNNDTLHVFVNHWPSRYGGVSRSNPLRCAAAKALKNAIDSLKNCSSDPKIVIMGDFNDYPDNASLQKCLGIQNDSFLVNLAESLKEGGSYKHNGRWGYLDQFIVSKSLVFPNSSELGVNDGLKVFKDDFVLERDRKYTGKKPKRTFIGYKYNGGYSDHLPVYIILKK